jgi:hypothetical protein
VADVLPKELQLVRDHGLVCRPVIDVEVVDARVHAQLTVRGLPGGADGRPRRCSDW